MVLDLGKISTRVHALIKLKRGGEAAEAAILRKFDELNKSDHDEAIIVLGDVGTRKSIPLLEKLAKDGNVFASIMLKQIEHRENRAKK